MKPEVDLMAELEKAGKVMSGEVERIVTEWGVRRADGTLLTNYGGGGETSARQLAAAEVTSEMAVVRREVIYGPWCDVGPRPECAFWHGEGACVECDPETDWK